jgi:hypothetical protein
MKCILKAAMISVLFVGLLAAQYSMEWSVQQDAYERGLLYFDVNRDSIPEITKFWWNTVTLYDGANNYAVLWYVVSENYDNLILWELYEFDQDSVQEALFIRSSTLDTVLTSLMVMPALSQEILWTTADSPGVISFLDTSDLDQDGIREIVFGVNRYENSDSSYYSTLYVIDSRTGSTEWAGTEAPGYIIGPYLGDLDGDGQTEILVNRYDYVRENYLLEVYSYSGDLGVARTTGTWRTMHLAPNYPNPFNRNTVIPLELTEPQPVSIVVVDLQGREVAQIVDGLLPAGRHQFFWAGRDSHGRPLPSGMYYYRVTTRSRVDTHPMLLVK